MGLSLCEDVGVINNRSERVIYPVTDLVSDGRLEQMALSRTASSPKTLGLFGRSAQIPLPNATQGLLLHPGK
jgi:hypothetical protein